MNETFALGTVKHSPDYANGVIGCRGYAPMGLLALVAGNEGHFINKGIVEGTTIFVQTLYPFQKGKVNVFLVDENDEENYKLSFDKIDGEYIGQAVVAFTDLSGI